MPVIYIVLHCVEFEVLTVVSVERTVLRFVMLCGSPFWAYFSALKMELLCFSEALGFLQLHSVTAQNIIFFIVLHYFS
jgi:hypothetical protein